MRSISESGVSPRSRSFIARSILSSASRATARRRMRSPPRSFSSTWRRPRSSRRGSRPAMASCSSAPKPKERPIRRESSTALAYGLQGHEVNKGRRLRNGLEFGQTTMPGHLDENRSFVSRWRMDSTEGDDLPTHDLVPVPVLFDLRRFRHEVDAAVHALEDKKGPTSRLVLCSADDASAELHTRDELAEVQRCMGIHQKLAVPHEAPPEVAGQLDALKRCAVVFGELEGALSDAPGETDAGEKAEPSQELEAQPAASLGARYRRLELDSPLRIRPARERLVEVAIVACLDRALPGSGEVALKPEAKRLGCELLAPQADSVPHVFPRHRNSTPSSLRPRITTWRWGWAVSKCAIPTQSRKIPRSPSIVVTSSRACWRRSSLSPASGEMMSFQRRGSPARSHRPTRSAISISSSEASKPWPGRPSCWAPSRAR